METNIQNLLSLDEHGGLFFVDTNPETSSPSPTDSPKPRDPLMEDFKSNGRYYEDPNPLIKCFNCNEFGHMSNSCQSMSYKFRCNYCGELGHTAYSCTQIVCHRCLNVGHKINQCRADTNDKCGICRRAGHRPRVCMLRDKPLEDSQLAKLTCLNCGEIGHTNCYELESYSKTVYCCKCAEKGHLWDECDRKRNREVEEDRRKENEGRKKQKIDSLF
ncbi:unnamed protein product [Blepharisma stoltei]|uniref:CCHC-type domain-containing protein n=1 Tax=Blepharisma stoltei TaxID=1481888 RepID=A0AAU9K610_9CILI|nr:unnamed protein product [Blepharisma stoltei]